ncbi:MAG TPA: hypothetical protein VFY93_13975 [Planctomycetota bacterium]|nr:hypothetical protein [Planctomycetota bacterium]
MDRSMVSRPIRVFLALFACSLALAQEPLKNPEGGRDGGEGPAIHFVRWHKSAETAAIYLAAWRALEPHLVDIARRRLVDFDGDPRQAKAYFEKERDIRFIVAFGKETAAAARAAAPGTPLVEVSESPDADVVLRVDRTRLAVLVKLLHARAKVALFGPVDEQLADLETKRCATAADATGCDIAWVSEGGTLPEGVTIPVVSTAADVPATVTVRPNATSAGLKIASLIVGKLRDGREPTRQHVARLHVAVDLGAAPKEVDLRVLAHADAVRRGP